MILTTLALSMSLPLSLQGVGETAVAIENDNPETWTVEYPRLIRPFVVEYRTCLNAANRRVTGSADFEAQHRSDIPRCAEERAELIAKSNAEMADAKTRISPQEVDTLFRNIGLIHIERGRDLDDQFRQRMEAAQAARDTYEANRPEGLVIERRPRERAPENTEGSTGAPD